MDGGTSPQWAEMQLLNRQDISSVSLHGLGSDQLHLHISAFPPSTAGAEGHSASSGSDAEPSQDSEPGRGRHVGAAPKAKQGSDLQQHYSSRGKGPAAPPEKKHAHADGDSFPNGTTDAKWRRSGSLPSSEHGSKAEKDAQSHVSKAHPVPCQRGPPSSKLILAADIALNDLERLPDILGSLRCSKPALDGPDSLIAWQQHSLLMFDDAQAPQPCLPLQGKGSLRQVAAYILPGLCLRRTTASTLTTIAMLLQIWTTACCQPTL